MDLRVGVLGAGMMGDAHLTAYRAAGVDIVGVADPNLARAEDLAGRFGTKAFSSPESLLDIELDAVSVCVPHSLHHKYALAAAQHRLHILMEKPLALSMQEARDIRSACEENGVLLMMGFIQRFMKSVQQLKSWVREGRFGEITTMTDYLAAGGPWPNVPDWYLRRSIAGGGILMIGTVHAIDRMRWISESEVKTVRACVRQSGAEGDVENVGSILLEFENGICCSLFGYRSPLSTHVRQHMFAVYGTKGEASLDLNSLAHQRYRLTTPAGSEEFQITEDDPFQSEINEFVRCIGMGRAAGPALADGHASLAVVLAAYESAKAGKTICLHEFVKSQEEECL